MTDYSMKCPNLPANARDCRVEAILERLDERWTPSNWEPNGRPVDELVGTILSQNTSDTNTERSFASLRHAFPRWSDVVRAPVDEIVNAIRAGGLSQQKAPRIQKAVAQLLEDQEEDPNARILQKLEDMSAEDGMAWLTSMDGVGPKTAACVLLFAVGKPVVPVDTHVHRVSKRIGIISEKTDANGAHTELLGIVPPAESYRFHVHLIQHGRTICKARKPLCTDCVVRDLCDYGRTTQECSQRASALPSERCG